MHVLSSGTWTQGESLQLPSPELALLTALEKLRQAAFSVVCRLSRIHKQSASRRRPDAPQIQQRIQSQACRCICRLTPKHMIPIPELLQIARFIGFFRDAPYWTVDKAARGCCFWINAFSTLVLSPSSRQPRAVPHAARAVFVATDVSGTADRGQFPQAARAPLDASPSIALSNNAIASHEARAAHVLRGQVPLDGTASPGKAVCLVSPPPRRTVFAPLVRARVAVLVSPL